MAITSDEPRPADIQRDSRGNHSGKVADKIADAAHTRTPQSGTRGTLTRVHILQKTRVLKELAQLYPDVNPLWREWVYDVCANTPLDQLEDMKQRIATNPGKHANPCGGVLQTA